jgi:hypothetical protein
MKTNYKINTEIVKNIPLVNVEISYKDEFFNDKYNLIGVVREGELRFNILKNEKPKTLKEAMQYSTVSYDGVSLSTKPDKDFFIESLSKYVNDYDCIEDFKNNHLESFVNEIAEFISKCNSSMISEGKIYEGYKDKMKRMAGIIEQNKNIR